MKARFRKISHQPKLSHHGFAIHVQLLSQSSLRAGGRQILFNTTVQISPLLAVEGVEESLGKGALAK